MAIVIDNYGLLPSMLAAERAIALVYVPWAIYSRYSRKVLDTLELTRGEWCPESAIGFYVVQPESEKQLNTWYEDLCRQYAPRFELHGHGWGPLWAIIRGNVVDCIYKAYEQNIDQVRERFVNAFKLDGEAG